MLSSRSFLASRLFEFCDFIFEVVVNCFYYYFAAEDKVKCFGIIQEYFFEEWIRLSILIDLILAYQSVNGLVFKEQLNGIYIQFLDNGVLYV